MMAALPLFGGGHAAEARPISPAAMPPGQETSPAAPSIAAGAFSDMEALHARLTAALPILRASPHRGPRLVAVSLDAGFKLWVDGQAIGLELPTGHRHWITPDGMVALLREIAL